MATFSKSSYSASSYADFRPTYPDSLYQAVLSYHRGPRSLCLDLGCGHGVVSRALSSEFSRVIGIDPSEGMIAQARSSTPASSCPNVEFHQNPAEHLPFIKDNSVDMVVSGQAAHWFDLAGLFHELRRVVRKNGTVAFWGYRDPVFVGHSEANAILEHYCATTGTGLMGDYWSQPGRSIQMDFLRPIQPPELDWEDLQHSEYEPGGKDSRSDSSKPKLVMSKKLTLAECKEYIKTFSAYHAWREAHPEADREGGDILDEMFDKMIQAEESWKPAGLDTEVEIEWGSALLLARKR